MAEVQEIARQCEKKSEMKGMKEGERSGKDASKPTQRTCVLKCSLRPRTSVPELEALSRGQIQKPSLEEHGPVTQSLSRKLIHATSGEDLRKCKFAVLDQDEAGHKEGAIFYAIAI